MFALLNQHFASGRLILRISAIALLFSAASVMASVIEHAAVSRSTMNPTLGDVVSLTATFARAGSVTVQVVDRDGFPTRFLAQSVPTPRGSMTFSWDGRDEQGDIVADEAYSFRIDWSDASSHETYFPADSVAPMKSVDAEYYAARTATLAYELPVPSRIHLQAGVGIKNPKTGAYEGPVMKTIVNREPRAAGRIAEPWNGLDESGRLHVADMKDFVIAIAATPLPESSVITFGNRKRTFAHDALSRRGRSLFTHPAKSHIHHAGLAVLDDISPRMVLQPLNASWSPTDGEWRTNGRTLRVRVSLEGPAAPTFARHPGKMFRFVDGKLVAMTGRPDDYPAELSIRLDKAVDAQVVSVNWRSDYGAVAANSLRVRVIESVRR